MNRNSTCLAFAANSGGFGASGSAAALFASAAGDVRHSRSASASEPNPQAADFSIWRRERPPLLKSMSILLYISTLDLLHVHEFIRRYQNPTQAVPPGEIRVVTGNRLTG